MPFLKSFPDDATQVDIFKRWPELAEPLGQFSQQVLRGSPFTNEQAELIFAFTSGVNACKYCYNIHREAAENLGLKKDVLEDLLNDIDSADIDEKMKPILRYVQKLTETSYKAVQKDVDAILDAGWSDDAFHYAVSICALANYFNRILNGHGIEGNPELWKIRGQYIAAEESYLQPNTEA